MSDAAPLCVLVVSGDANFRRLVAAVLRDAGHTVATMDLRPARVAGRLRLRPPDLLLIDADRAVAAALERDAGAETVVVRAEEEPGRATSGMPVVGKWWPPSRLVAALTQAARPPARPRLRLVRP